MNLINPDHTRYIGAPMFLKPGTVVGRGLSVRKGNDPYYASIRDVIAKGCGTASASSVVAEEQSWSKIGHIFGTHDTELFFSHEGTYFYGSDCAFIVFSSDYYNEEYLRGEARLESEKSLNTVLYRGLPRREILALYLDIENQADIQALISQEPIETVQSKLTSKIFKNLTVKELVHLRRHLISKDKMKIDGKSIELSFAERIKYFDSRKNTAKLTEDRLNQDGFVFSKKTDIHKETLRRAMGCHLISNNLDNKNLNMYLQ